MVRPFRNAALTLTAIALAIGAPCTRTLATFPGRNGLITFATRGTNGCMDPHPLKRDSIYTISPDGTHLRQVAVGLSPNWSPDGKWIAYSRWTYVGIMRANGTHKRRIHFRPSVIPGYPAQKAAQVRFWRVAWSPDGTQLLAASLLPSYQISNLVTFPAKAHVPASDVRTIATDVYDKVDWSVDLPTEPAGLIVFDNNPPECSSPSSGYIFVVSPFGGAARQLFYPGCGVFPGNPVFSGKCGCPAFNASWDPSGSRLAYTDNSHIFIGDAGGGSSVQLTTDNPGGAFNPAWSPQGDAIVFMRQGYNTSELYLIDPTTRRETLLPNTVCGDSPAWQPLKF